MKELVGEYGGALFALADEESLADVILAEIREITPLLDKDYIRLLSAPNIGMPERLSCIDEAFGGRINSYLSSFLKMMTERGYAGEIVACFAEFDRLYREKNGIVEAKVKSAVALTEEQKTALTEKLSRRTGKTVRLSCTVDPSLIGGISVALEGELMDGSVRKHLQELQRRIMDTQL